MFTSARAVVALLLLAIWGPATAHCSIAAATDWLAELCSVTCCDDDAAQPAHADACDLVEDGGYVPAVSPALAPAPQLTALACLSCLHARLLAEARPLPSPAWAKDHPRDWVPIWRFTRRAAPPARAPDLT